MAKKPQRQNQNPGGTPATGRRANRNAQTGAGEQVPYNAPRRERRSATVQNRKAQRARAQQRQKQQWLLTRIGIGVVVLALIAWAGWAFWQNYQGSQVRDDTVAYFGKDSFVSAHYGGNVLYEQIPPVGGWHNNIWQNCGYYNKPIANVHGVHSLEYGAVWITYNPDLPENQVDELKGIADQPFTLVSPYPGMQNPVTLSIWGHQLKLDSFDKGKIDAFIREFKKKQEYTPEFGGVCYGGTSATTDEMPQQQPYVQADPNAAAIGGIRDIDATATAEALNPAQQPATPAASPAASPGATPEATPAAAGSPVAVIDHG